MDKQRIQYLAGILTEVQYQHDPRKQFLQKYFELDTTDTDDDWKFEMWVPKEDVIITAEINDERHIVNRVASSRTARSEKWKWFDQIFTVEWDGAPLPDHIKLQHLSVWKKVT